MTSIRIFGLNPLAQTPEVVSGGDLPEVIRRTRPIWETQIIREDSRELLPGWARADAPDAWYRFENGTRTLYLKEIHVDHGEQLLGGDLVYVRQNPDAMVVVQYKRLLFGPRSADARCTVDERFRKQLTRMVETGRALSSASTPAGSSSSEFRLSSSLGYIKFIEDRPKVRAEGQIYEGYYFPAELLSAMLEESSSRVLGIDLRNDRWLSSDSFIRLVSGGWIGTAGAKTANLLRMLDAEGIIKGSDTTIAIETGA